MRYGLTAVAALWFGALASAQAGECPYARDLDTIRAAIQAAPLCATAAAIAIECAYGASGDVALGAAVTTVCEKDFLAALTPSGRRSYARRRAACAAKYAGRSGSMYQSFEAFCESKVAERFSEAARAGRLRGGPERATR